MKITMNEPDNNPNTSQETVEDIIGQDNGVELPETPEVDPAKPVEDNIDVENLVGDEEPEINLEAEAEEEPLTPAAEVEKWKEVAARSQADLENFRKRMARDKTESIQYANTSLLMSLFPVIDNFEMGLKAAENEDSKSIIFQGMSMVYKQINDFLSENRVETITAEAGENFDHNAHEALKQEPSDTVAEGKILYTLRRGYRLQDRLLRAANVVVSSGPETASEEAEASTPETPT